MEEAPAGVQNAFTGCSNSRSRRARGRAKVERGETTVDETVPNTGDARKKDNERSCSKEYRYSNTSDKM